MLGRIALASAALVLAGASSAFAAPFVPFWVLAHDCAHSGLQTQCALQIVNGDYNAAYTVQYARHHGRPHHSSQFSLTYQDGDGNLAYTGQVGGNQTSLTVQVGDDNKGLTYQAGGSEHSSTVELGSGQWSATSSIGAKTSTSVVLTSF